MPSCSSLLVKKVERGCPRVLLFGFGPGAGCEDIFLAARRQTLLSRRPTRQSQLLHVYSMAIAYVSFLLGFPCETVTGGGGYVIQPGARIFQTGFTVFQGS